MLGAGPAVSSIVPAVGRVLDGRIIGVQGRDQTVKGAFGRGAIPAFSLARVYAARLEILQLALMGGKANGRTLVVRG